MAGAGKKTFTAGEVLTASDVNTYLMEQSVMVFGGTAARSSAIPTPSEGMVTYQTDKNQIDAYNGSAWVGMGGLQLIKTQEIGTGVSSVTVTNAFSATYDAYKIIISGGVAAANKNLSIQIGNATSGYKWNLIYSSYGGGVTNATTAAGSDCGYCGYASTSTLTMNYDIINPYLTKNTYFSNFWNTINESGSCGGVLNNSNSYTDFTVKPDATTLTGGTIAVYGYAK